MSDKVQERNMTQGYMFQKMANAYWLAVKEYAEKIGNKHLANKIRDIFKSSEKIFTPIDVYMKKHNSDDSVYDIQITYMEIFHMISELSPDDLLKEKERLLKKMKGRDLGF